MQYGPATYSISYQSAPLIRFVKRTMVCEVQAIVARYFGLRVSDLKSACRARRYSRPRQIAMYLASQHTRNNYSEIGRRFGNRDHTTVIHAIRQIDKLREIDAEVAADVRELSRGFIGKAGWA